MILAIQTSALPEERPDETIFSKYNIPNWKSRFKNFLHKEGAYNFAKMAVQIKNASDDFCMEKYSMNAMDAFRLCELIWVDKENKEGIEEFIRNCKTKINHSLRRKGK